MVLHHICLIMKGITLFVVSDEEPVDVVEVLKKSGAEILVNYLPVGSEKSS